MAKEVCIQIRVDQETKDKVTIAARKDGRTISNYLLHLADKDMKERGIFCDDEKKSLDNYIQYCK